MSNPITVETVTVTTSPTPLGGYDNFPRFVAVRPTSASTWFMGGPDVNTSDRGVEISGQGQTAPPGSDLIKLEGGQQFYGITASGTTDVQIVTIPAY